MIADIGVPPIIDPEPPHDGIHLLAWRAGSAVDREKTFLIRRIQLDPARDLLRLICDNPAYPPIEVKPGSGRSYLSVPGEPFDAMNLANRHIYGPVIAVLGKVT